MKVFVTSSLLVVLVAVVLRLTGTAEPPENAAQAAPQPPAPALWNVSGQTEVDGLQVTVQPVACPDGTAAGRLCVEVTAENPGATLAHARLPVSLLANNDSAMSRIARPPSLVEVQPASLQVPGGGQASAMLVFTLPNPLPMTLSLALTSDEDPSTGVWMASVSPGLDPDGLLGSIDDRPATF